MASNENQFSVLLDTCAVIFIANGDRLHTGAQAAITRAAVGGGVLVSPVSAWEVGLLTAKGRVQFQPNARQWFLNFLALDGVRLIPLTAEAAIDSAFLAPPFHGDPADRLLTATAQALHVPMVTRDKRLLAYAEAGHMKAIHC
jgi:PIN domain nuclease of toxin-antitoxin system